jgi:hypothetical protein
MFYLPGIIHCVGLTAADKIGLINIPIYLYFRKKPLPKNRISYAARILQANVRDAE